MSRQRPESIRESSIRKFGGSGPIGVLVVPQGPCKLLVPNACVPVEESLQPSVRPSLKPNVLQSV